MGSVGVARAGPLRQARGGEATQSHVKRSLTRVRDRARGAEAAGFEVKRSESHAVLQLLSEPAV
jgi:hypothetical protein